MVEGASPVVLEDDYLPSGMIAPGTLSLDGLACHVLLLGAYPLVDDDEALGGRPVVRLLLHRNLHFRCHAPGGTSRAGALSGASRIDQ